MRARMMIEEPGGVAVTMKITMSADEWETLREALWDGNHPLYTPMGGLVSAINDLLAQVRKVLYPAEPAPAE